MAGQVEVHTTVPAIVAAFTEWDRRYREDPRSFETDMQRLQRGQTPETYGEEVTPYFMHLLDTSGS